MTLETLVALGIMVILAVGCAGFLKTEWNVDRCAYQVFEVTRARLSGKSRPDLKLAVKLTETPESVEGVARCGAITERVRLPKLENAK